MAKLTAFSKMQRCDKHVINLLAIQEVSKLSWRAIQEDYSIEKYEEDLRRLLMVDIITPNGLLLLVLVLPVVDSVYSLVVTGQHSSMLL